MKRQKERSSKQQTESRVLSREQPFEEAHSKNASVRKWLPGVLLVALIFAAYWRACAGQFIWDDDANVMRNTALRSFAGLAQIWFQPGATQQYYPLTHTSFWLDFNTWGLNPLPYHVENILLHSLSAVLLWILLRRLAVPGAWLGAALWALHPAGAESVAWITERKNTLAGVFFLASLMMSAKFWLTEPAEQGTTSNRGTWKFYWLGLLFYLCALWSKTATIGLPAVIVLLIWWKRGAAGMRDALLLLPFAAVGIGSGLVTLWVEKHNLGAAGKEWTFSILERCWLAGRIFWFYLGKLAWPHPLMFIYPRWQISLEQPVSWTPLAVAIALLFVLWWKRNSWGRPIFFAVGFFIVMLFPVLGFFNVFFFRFSFVCDHFQYLASIAPLALVGAGITKSSVRYPASSIYIRAVAGIILAILGLLTWHQTGVFHDRETLWRDTLAHNPNAWMAENNLGSLMLQKGDTDEAIAHFEKSLKIKSDNAEAHNNLGGIFLRMDRVDDAIGHFETALELKPDYSAARANLGAAMVQSGRVDEGIRDYEIALQLAPDDLSAHVNIADALFHQGRAEEAVKHYEKAIDLARKAGRENLAQELEAELKKQQARPQ